jgi:hypothetical protein
LERKVLYNGRKDYRTNLPLLALVGEGGRLPPVTFALSFGMKGSKK